jgi:hypothetical protein
MHIDKKTLDEWEVEKDEFYAFLKVLESQIQVAIIIWIAIGTFALTWAVLGVR